MKVGAGYINRSKAIERRIKRGGELIDKFTQAAYDAVKAERDTLKIALGTIYMTSNAVESGWTAPVYRDALTAIKNCAQVALDLHATCCVVCAFPTTNIVQVRAEQHYVCGECAPAYIERNTTSRECVVAGCNLPAHTHEHPTGEAHHVRIVR